MCIYMNAHKHARAEIACTDVPYTHATRTYTHVGERALIYPYKHATCMHASPLYARVGTLHTFKWLLPFIHVFAHSTVKWLLLVMHVCYNAHITKK